MSRFLTRRRSPTMRDFNEHRARWDEYEANAEEAQLARFERDQDDLEARRDARDSWTPRPAA
jgi:putative hemolysin